MFETKVMVSKLLHENFGKTIVHNKGHPNTIVNVNVIPALLNGL